MSHRPLVPDNFDPPETYDAGTFKLCVLGPELLALDYDAYMSSIDHLQGCFGPDTAWPVGVTLEKALIDVAWCMQEFWNRSSFSYAALAPDGSYEMGCLYVFPTIKAGYEAQVSTWTRKSEADKGFDAALFAFAKQWVESDWPLSKIAYPGREVSWVDWATLPNKPLA